MGSGGDCFDNAIKHSIVSIRGRSRDRLQPEAMSERLTAEQFQSSAGDRLQRAGGSSV